MSTTTTTTTLSDDLESRAIDLVERLKVDPFFGRLMYGEVNSEEYAAFLMQMHRWIRHAIRGLRGHADAMVARAARDPRQRSLAVCADRHTEEEVDHAQMIIDDLAVLWECSPDEALGRIEREEASPSTLEWERLLDGLLARSPSAFSGIAVAMETVSGLTVDQIISNVRQQAIPRIEQALTFMVAHSSEVEEGHVDGAKMRLERLQTPAERAAAFYYGAASLAMFETTHRYLAERFPAPALELAGAGI